VDRSQDEKEKEEVKMGARVNLWVLVFALVLISSTWYISELPDYAYLSMTEPHEISFTGVEDGGEPTVEETIEVSGTEYSIVWQTESNNSYFYRRGRRYMQDDTLWSNNQYRVWGHKYVSEEYAEEGGSIYPNYYPNGIDRITLPGDGVTYYIIIHLELTPEYCLNEQAYFLSFMLRPMSGNYGITQINPWVYLYYNTETGGYTVVHDYGYGTLAIGVTRWYNLTLSEDTLTNLTSNTPVEGWHSFEIVIKYADGAANQRYLTQLDFEARLLRPVEEGAYTDNGTTVIVRSIFSKLDIMKVSGGLVGAMCILAAVASTPLWNPTRAWRGGRSRGSQGRRRGRR